jgi:hypothetical protein
MEERYVKRNEPMAAFTLDKILGLSCGHKDGIADGLPAPGRSAGVKCPGRRCQRETSSKPLRSTTRTWPASTNGKFAGPYPMVKR